MLNVIVIGSGTMGGTHANAYSNISNVNLVGIVDVQLEKASLLAKKLGTNSYKTYEEAKVEIGEVDIVSICLPTPLHLEFVKKIADTHTHIICEKPLARSLEDAKEIIDYCNIKGVKLFVGHVVRFFKEYSRAKQLIEDRKIGKPAVVNTSRIGGFPDASNDWYSNYSKSGGLVLDMIIHDFDFLRWCFGEVDHVYAKSSKGRVNSKLEYALVTLKFKNGVIAHVEGSWAHQKFTTKFDIAGTEGILNYDSSKVNPIFKSIKEFEGSHTGVAVPESPLKATPYQVQLEHFISCIIGDKKPIVTAIDAYKAMEISLAALKSIDTGRVVEISNKEMGILL
ncbi:dehydrogenase [Oceanobacillus sp. E9]|uniref:Gfo/Idh/MocA family protein n=1 Tax=Oceanobacillus TaxID=182709 RepID=UPI00084EB3D8|nr:MULTISPECIES: Gfo/Idh/MocA family oxidoreductase [Oceanobacillus]OEH56460.1 dehydrogenase [Oceanobacillus sp. E9]